MTREEYYQETITVALDEMGKLSLFTDVVLKELGEAIYGSVTCESMAFGDDITYANRSAEIDREIKSAKQEAERERRKIVCKECAGSGFITMNGPYHSFTSQCFKCNGDGRHDP